MKTTRFILPAALLAASFALPARSETHVNIDLGLRLGPPAPIVVREAPPRPVIIEQERRMPTPGPDYVWVAGHNSWRNSRWVWIPGTWTRPPQRDVIYVEGRWDERSRNWIEAHWEVVARPANPPRYDDRRGPPGPDVIVIAPPPPRKEHRGHRPSPDYMWIPGYWAWHGNHHEWIAGRWSLPPHGRRYWEAPRWDHRGNSYVFIEGRWR